jgi:exonuclease VII large subunit
MDKLISQEKHEYFCDTCNKNLVKEFYGVPITIIFGYGHKKDDTIAHFCSDKCLIKYIKNE